MRESLSVCVVDRCAKAEWIVVHGTSDHPHVSPSTPDGEMKMSVCDADDGANLK